MIFAIKIFLSNLILFPMFLCYQFKDRLYYKIHHLDQIFDRWGLHIYVARFGAGKTCSMVRDAYKLCKAYKELTLITNIKVTNFPKHTKILPLNNINDILNAPAQSLVLIDEIGTLFNSRDFRNGDAMPKILMQYLCQCRHRRCMIFGTVQRWHFLDKQLRDITGTVRVVSSYCAHPFTRMVNVRMYDGLDYDLSYTNPMIKCNLIGSKTYVQTDKIRALYDTTEMVSTLLTLEYDSDQEILSNQGYSSDLVDIDRKQQRKLHRNKSKMG